MATPASSSNCMATVRNTHESDHQQPQPQGSKNNETSTKHYSRQTRHRAHAHDKQRRPDPPGCVIESQQQRPPRPNRMQTRLNKSPSHHTQSLIKMPPQKSYCKQHKREGCSGRFARDHEERPNRLSIVANTKSQRSSPRRKQSRPQEAQAIQRPREDVGNFDRQPAKSSSFQSHPDQLLQVYKDLFKEQLDNSKTRCRDNCIDEKETGLKFSTSSDGGDSKTTTTYAHSSSSDEIEEGAISADYTKTMEELFSELTTSPEDIRSSTKARTLDPAHSSDSTSDIVRAVESPPFPSMDDRLLQRQIRYLQHEPDMNITSPTGNADTISPSSQLIIYPSGKRQRFKLMGSWQETVHWGT